MLSKSLTFRTTAFFLGFSTMITQVVMLREFLTVFLGNELVIGVVMAVWMLLTGLGAQAGRLIRTGRPDRIISWYFLLTGLLPLPIYASLHLIQHRMFPSGVMTGLTEALLLSVILLLPFCLMSGAFFTWLSARWSEGSDDNRISSTYGLESAGAVAGGFILSIFLFIMKGTFPLLVMLAMINLAMLFILSGLPWKIAAAILTAGLLATAMQVPLDLLIKKNKYPGQEILRMDYSPYGDIIATGYLGQINFYENGTPLFSTADIVSAEESVHYALSQHPHPSSVLLISGGTAGLMNEILKYPVTRIDYAETNPVLIETMLSLGIIDEKDERLNLIGSDPRLHIKKTSTRYDAVLVQASEPSNAQANRFYTSEFFSGLKEKMNNEAVVSVGFMPTSNYISRETIEIHSRLYSTLAPYFRHILIVPGHKFYYLASDAPLRINVPQLLNEKGIATVYLNSDYIDTLDLSRRSEEIHSSLKRDVDANRDFRPIGYYLQLQYWLSLFSASGQIWIWILLILLVYYLVRMRAPDHSLFVSGFTASSLEIMLLIAFQMIYGVVYQATGFIVMLFMTGLALGSLVLAKKMKSDKSSLARTQYLFGAFSITAAMLMVVLQSISVHTGMVYSVIFVLAVMSGVFTGIIFSLTTRLKKGTYKTTAAALYESDLAGSAAGALVTTVYLIPLLGFIRVGFFLMLVNILVAAGVSFVLKKT
ncbi:MAG: hypothetical protein JW861_12035 [Bacteroidales bacterium]|nr:hypothetical protein [Bacteroidales bacterium]